MNPASRPPAAGTADRPMTGLQWTAATVLRVARAVRRFNADQIELQERWLRRSGLLDVAAPSAPTQRASG